MAIMLINTANTCDCMLCLEPCGSFISATLNSDLQNYEIKLKKKMWRKNNRVRHIVKQPFEGKFILVGIKKCHAKHNTQHYLTALMLKDGWCTYVIHRRAFVFIYKEWR